MLLKFTKATFINKIAASAVFGVLIIFANGCKTNFLNSETPAAPAASQPQSAPEPIVVNGVRTSYADVVDKTSPAVVRIESEIKADAAEQPQQSPFGSDDFFKQFGMPAPRQQQQQRPQIERGLGSGVIVSADGTILTNFHVINGATKITVQMNDNKTFVAKVVGTDQPSDLAVIKIEGASLPFLNLGNSDNVRIGDIVLAIGNPLGIGQTVTAGIISAKGRRTGLSDGSFEDFLQTDAPINRGNSGGALVNLNGELIGINSQILSSGGNSGSIGIGFSIPSNMAKTVMEQLVQNGKVRRGMLGVNIQNISPDIAKALDLKDTQGVIVSNVRAGSSAEKAGIKRGDVITAVNGEKVDDGNVLRNKVAQTLPGNSIKITVLRDGNSQDLTATLDEFSSENAKADNPQKNGGDNTDKQQSTGKLGLNLQPLTPQTAKQVGVPADTEGMIVTEVDPNGAAAEQGIDQGDVILEINRKPVKSVEDVKTILDASGDKPLFLLISRKGQTIYLTVNPK